MTTITTVRSGNFFIFCAMACRASRISADVDNKSDGLWKCYYMLILYIMNSLLRSSGSCFWYSIVLNPASSPLKRHLCSTMVSFASKHFRNKGKNSEVEARFCVLQWWEIMKNYCIMWDASYIMCHAPRGLIQKWSRKMQFASYTAEAEADRPSLTSWHGVFHACYVEVPIFWCRFAEVTVTGCQPINSQILAS